MIPVSRGKLGTTPQTTPLEPVEASTRAVIACTVLADGHGDFGFGLRLASSLLRSAHNHVTICALCFADQRAALTRMARGFEHAADGRAVIRFYTATDMQNAHLARFLNRVGVVSKADLSSIAVWPAAPRHDAFFRETLAAAAVLLIAPVENSAWAAHARNAARVRGIPSIALAFPRTDHGASNAWRAPEGCGLLGLGRGQVGLPLTPLSGDDAPFDDAALSARLMGQADRATYIASRSLFVAYLRVPKDYGGHADNRALNNFIRLSIDANSGDTRDVDFVCDSRDLTLPSPSFLSHHGFASIVQEDDEVLRLPDSHGGRILRLLRLDASVLDFSRLLSLSRDSMAGGVLLAAAMGEASYTDLLSLKTRSAYYPVLVPRYTIQEAYGVSLAERAGGLKNDLEIRTSLNSRWVPDIDRPGLAHVLSLFVSWDFRHGVFDDAAILSFAAVLRHPSAQRQMRTVLEDVRLKHNCASELSRHVRELGAMPRRRAPFGSLSLVCRTLASAVSIALVVGLVSRSLWLVAARTDNSLSESWSVP